MNPEIKVLEYEGKKYAYHYSIITAEQAEIIREIAEFKAMQDDAPTTDINEYLRSGGHYWKLLCARYLVREVKAEGVAPFSIAKAETDVFEWIKKLPFELFDEFFTENLKDFFTNSKRAYLISALLQSEKRSQKINPLLMNLMKSLGETKKQQG